MEDKNFGFPEFISDITNKDRAKYKDIDLGNIQLIKNGDLDYSTIDQDAFYLVIRVYNKGFYLLGPYSSVTICKWAKAKVALLELFNFKRAHVVMCKGKDLLKKFPGMFHRVAMVQAAFSKKNIINFSLDEFMNFAAVNEEVKSIVDEFPYKKDYLKAAADPKFKMSYSSWLKETHPDSFEKLISDPNKLKIADEALAKDVKVLKTLAKYGTTNPTAMQKVKKALTSPTAKILYGVAGVVAVGLLGKYVYDKVPIKINNKNVTEDASVSTYTDDPKDDDSFITEGVRTRHGTYLNPRHNKYKYEYKEAKSVGDLKRELDEVNREILRLKRGNWTKEEEEKGHVYREIISENYLSRKKRLEDLLKGKI